MRRKRYRSSHHTAQAPEEVRMLGRTGPPELPVGGDNIDGQKIVAYRAEAAQRGWSPTQRQPAMPVVAMKPPVGPPKGLRSRSNLPR
jgi:hypothetical protein